jgi:lipopolysaccharide/colanic/teichoic acid biosynthesis glycosyltransferase
MTVVIAILSALLLDELLGCIDCLCRWLVRRQAAKTPAELSARLEEEWLAHLAELPGKLSRLLFAMDLWRASRVVSQDAVTALEIPKDWALSLFCVRIVDLCTSIVLFVLSLPCFAIVFLAVRVETGRPVIEAEERVGLHGRVFRLFKFRTRERDGRALTRVGHILTSLSLDTLPMILNVMRGEMSLVGPEAHPPSEANRRKERVRVPDWYDYRHAVRPGITGWAQVCDNVTDEIAQLQYDLYFVKHISPLFWLQILFETVKVLLLRRFKTYRRRPA